MSDVVGSARTSLAARADYAPLGSFRLLLALMVLLHHAAAQIGPPAIADAVGPLEPGSIAVYVFFVLSGSIIAEAIQRTYEGRPFAFIANRMLRIVPSYAVALAAFIAAAGVAFALGLGSLAVEGPALTPADLVAPGVLLGNLVAILPGFAHGLPGAEIPLLIPIVWAIRVEILFYGAIFAALLVARVTGVSLGRILALIGAALLAWCAVRFEAGAASSLANAPFFVLGVAAQRLLAGRDTSTAATGLSTAFAVVAFALCVLRIASLDPVIAGTAHFRDHPTEIALFCGLLALFAGLTRLRISGRGPMARLDRRLGDLTYPLYLNHMAAISVAAVVASTPTVPIFLAAMGFAVAVSWLIAAPTEPVIARWRDRVRGGKVS